MKRDKSSAACDVANGFAAALGLDLDLDGDVKKLVSEIQATKRSDRLDPEGRNER